jgi:hypothetical protein
LAEIPFEGFKVDQGRAAAIADAIRAVLRQATMLDVSTPDQLAALGIVAAETIVASKLAGVPELAAQRLATYVVAWAKYLTPSSQP